MRNYNYFKHSKDVIYVKQGETIYQQGDHSGDTMYAVKTGVVDIVVNGRHVAQTVSEGEFFGEMSLVDSRERAGTAIARTDCEIVVVDKHRFLYLTHQSPVFAMQVMNGLAGRIRELQQGLG